MSAIGGTDLLIRARSALLDALEALREHLESVVLIGAQAIYLHTGELRVALPAMTKDSDLAIDSRTLAAEPLIEESMRAAGFSLHGTRPQPGTWISPSGIPVDLMVPEALSGEGGTRGARIPPHSNHATRRAVGLEASVVDRSKMRVASLQASDARSYAIWVAGPRNGGHGMRPAELERHLYRTPKCSPVDRTCCREQRKIWKIPHSRVRTRSGHRQRVQLLGDVGEDAIEP